MKENGKSRFRVMRLGDEETKEVDKLSNLPESLLLEILLKLATKDVVKTSVLSSSWRNLWRFIPILNLKYGYDFTHYKEFVSFVDGFLSFKSFSRIPNYKLRFGDKIPKSVDIIRWINKVIERKVQHLHLYDEFWYVDSVVIPTTVYTCESLVSLKLYKKILPRPEFVSLPCLKVLVLDGLVITDDSAFERLISSCLVLESLTVRRAYFAKVLCVRSQSLVRFTYNRHDIADIVFVIDAPRLKYLKLFDHDHDYGAESCIIDSQWSLVKVDININIIFNLSKGEDLNPDYVEKRNMIGNFISGISSVNVLKISSYTLEVIFNYSRCEPLPLFGNLSFLHVDFHNYYWEMLPILLESCPNLKSLFLDLSKSLPRREKVGIAHEARQLLTSIECVEIVKLMLEEPTHMKLVSYFLKNSPVLKKFTFFMDEFRKNKELVIFEKLLAIPILSSSCEFSVFEYADTL